MLRAQRSGWHGTRCPGGDEIRPPSAVASCEPSTSTVRSAPLSAMRLPRVFFLLSQTERTFLEHAESAEASLVNLAAWKAETVWVLLWALGVVEELALCPSQQCNLACVPNIERLLFASTITEFHEAAADSLYA